MTPTLFLTNWSSRKLHGPGRKLTIMAKPRAWEHGEGKVEPLMPDPMDLLLVRNGVIDSVEYRRRFEARLPTPERLAPGVLGFDDRVGYSPVVDGDTLCCACSREVAARGECHRVWAAEALVRAGWRVVLDGVEVPRAVLGGDRG